MEKIMILDPSEPGKFIEWNPHTLEVIRICEECKEGQIIKEGRCGYCPICGWSVCST